LHPRAVRRNTGTRGKFDFVSAAHWLRFERVSDYHQRLSPNVAEEVARSVAKPAFNGLYVDANGNLSGERTIDRFKPWRWRGISFDPMEGIIGEPGGTGLKWSLSADCEPQSSAGLLFGRPARDNVLGTNKRQRFFGAHECFAAYTKGSVGVAVRDLGLRKIWCARERCSKPWKTRLEMMRTFMTVV